MQLVNSFHDAAERGDIRTVDRMLQDGMPVDASDSDSKALHFATRSYRADVIKHLVHDGADVNRQSRYSKDTPLHTATRNNYTGLFRDNGGRGYQLRK